MKNADDRWLTRLRALLGSTAFMWDVIAGGGRLWVIVASLWLLGGPIEQILYFLTSGRIAISVQQPPDPPAAALPPPPAPKTPDPGGTP
jgi:hypothetical protein